tara:strand:- start:1376 stop:2500 length:1125 start_codon:yes stop_codon:yes gene_type:complete
MSEIRVNRIVNAAGSGAPQFPSGFSIATGMGITNSPNITGSAVTFSGLSQVTNATDSTSSTTGSLVVTGGVGIAKNVYIGAGLSVAGTLTYEDVTNVDSVGMITAKSGLNVSGGEVTVGSAVTIGSAGVATFAQNVNFVGAGAKNCTWNKGNGAFELEDNAKIKLGSGGDLSIYHDATNTIIDNTTGMLQLRTDSFRLYNQAGSENMIDGTANGSVKLYWDNTARYETTGAGSTSVGISTIQDFSSYGMLKERVEIVANRLSSAQNIEVEKGNVYYFTTNENTTSTPNIRYSSSKTLNNAMLIGETISVTIIYKPNGAGYYAALNVDGSGVTEEWLGGSAPSSANAGGYDVLTHTLTKTADATWLCLSNVQNFA